MYLEQRMDETPVYLTIVIAAQLEAGAASLACRAKRALEARGHTAFLFEPRRWPELFDERGRLDVGGLARFFEVQRPDVLLVAGGVGIAGESGCLAEAGVPVGALGSTPAEILRSAAGTVRPDFAVAVAHAAQLGVSGVCEEGVVRIPGFGGPVYLCEPCPDTPYLETPLANDVACPANVMCLQDATPERVSFMEDLADRPEMGGVEVACFGAGWPSRFARTAEGTSLPYMSRSSLACVVFSSAGHDGGDVPAAAPDGLLSEARLALVRSDGVVAVHVCEDGRDDVAVQAHGPRVRCGTAQDAALPYAEAAGTIASLAASLKADTAARRSRRLPLGYDGPRLEDALCVTLARVRASYAPAGLMAGSSSPRTVVCVLGYFGMGNFGDEFILSTIVDRLHERIPGSTVVAVGENPAHTLRARGVLSLTMADKRALDEALSYCSAALVAAGLLFDQGIRWTMGKAELISDMPHTDIPGIAAYAELAWLNGARPVFYGAGAGPLDVAAGRELVRLMGRLDALFLVRDDETAALIRSCGVPAGQVQTKADTAFLGRAGCCGSVDEWLDREGIDLGVSRLLAVSLREYENAPSDFASRVAAALDRAAQGHPDVEFAACVLDPGDLALACAVQRAMECGSRLHVFNAGDEIEPLADLLSRSSAGLSMRYHCSLLLGTFGVPCVGLGYLPKVVSLYRDLGQQDTLLDMDASCEQMASGLERVLGGDRTVTCELQARVGELRALAGEMED